MNLRFESAIFQLIFKFHIFIKMKFIPLITFFGELFEKVLSSIRTWGFSLVVFRKSSYMRKGSAHFFIKVKYRLGRIRLPL